MGRCQNQRLDPGSDAYRDDVERLDPGAALVDVGEILHDVQGFMTEALEKKISHSWTPELFLLQKDKLVDSAKRYLLSNRS